MAEEKILMYKGHPLMRKGNLLYYGSMAGFPIIVMLQILGDQGGQRGADSPVWPSSCSYRDPNEGPGPWSRRAKRPDCTPHWISAASGMERALAGK